MGKTDFPLNSGATQICPISLLLFNIELEVFVIEFQQENDNKGTERKRLIQVLTACR